MSLRTSNLQGFSATGASASTNQSKMNQSWIGISTVSQRMVCRKLRSFFCVASLLFIYRANQSLYRWSKVLSATCSCRHCTLESHTVQASLYPSETHIATCLCTLTDLETTCTFSLAQGWTCRHLRQTANSLASVAADLIQINHLESQWLRLLDDKAIRQHQAQPRAIRWLWLKETFPGGRGENVSPVFPFPCHHAPMSL